MSLYRYVVTRHSAHAVRVPGQDCDPDPLTIASEARAAELDAVYVACRMDIQRRRNDQNNDLRERAPEASRRLA